MTTQATSRRTFLKQSGTVVAGTALAGEYLAGVHAAENNTIKIALVGCGGRGGGAAGQALSTEGPTTLWALADVFSDRLEGTANNFAKQFAQRGSVPKDRQFLGMDGYRKAIDSIAPGGVVLLATPPAFRPIHLEYAVQRGCHVFMEKSFAVDAPGVRRVLRAGKEAEQKNLKIAGGLMSRHYKPLEECIEHLHNGMIGPLVTLYAYRVHGAVGITPRSFSPTELAHQIRNYSNFTWLNGSFLLDWLIHNLDVACWAKDAWPVSAQGQGGRQVRKEPDQLFDHYAVEYTFPDGTRLVAQGRHQNNTWGFFGDVILGANGCAVLGEMQPNPRIFKGYKRVAENQIWEYKGDFKARLCDHYQREHDLLFAAIRQDQKYNETQRCAYAAMTGILGRMAAESGQEITWEDALASNIQLAPGLDNLTMKSEPPVKPDAKGAYPVAMPGITKVL